MDTIHTLTQLLSDSHCEYQVFDLGRRITKIEPSAFAKVELGQQAYPFPMQRKAHIAIAYWNESKQPWIWFLKFELDERGLLKQVGVGNFIKYIIEAMGTRLGGELSEEQQEKLANNPYTFKPAEDKMAVFHSQVRAKLSMPTSQYYEHAQHYFSGGLGWNNWQTIGLQGIADICARFGIVQNSVMLKKALNQLPNEPLYALLGVLEHCELPENLGKALQEKALSECNSDTPDLFLVSALVRALAGSPNSLSLVVAHILQSPRLSHQEVLVGIAGRSWSSLADTERAGQFLLRLAQTGNQNLFNQLFADLVMLPELRMVLLPLLHNAPSQELATALLKLQQNTRSQ